MLSSNVSWQVHHPLTGMVVRVCNHSFLNHLAYQKPKAVAIGPILEQLIASLPRPGLCVRNGSGIGRNHLEHLPGRKFLEGLLRLDDGHWAEQARTVQRPVDVNSFGGRRVHISFPPFRFSCAIKQPSKSDYFRWSGCGTEKGDRLHFLFLTGYQEHPRVMKK